MATKPIAAALELSLCSPTNDVNIIHFLPNRLDRLTHDDVPRRPSRRNWTWHKCTSNGEKDGAIPNVLIMRDQQDHPSSDTEGSSDQAHQASLVELHRHVRELGACTMVSEAAVI